MKPSLPNTGSALRHYTRQLKWAVAVLVVAGGSVLIWRTTASPHHTSGVTQFPLVSVSRAQFGHLTAFSPQSLTMTPTQNVTVSPLVSGTISKILVSSGQVVSAGQPLAVLSNPALTSAVSQAEANVSMMQAKVSAAQSTGSTANGASQLSNNAQSQITLAEREMASVSSSGSYSAMTVAEDQKFLTIVQSPSGPYLEAISQAQSALQKAQSQVQQAQTSGSPSAITAAQEMLAFDQQELNSAQALDKTVVTFAQRNLATAQAAQSQAMQYAQQNLAAAKTTATDLNQLTASSMAPSSSTLTSLQQQLQAADSALSAAQTAVQDLTVKAPVAGTVSGIEGVSGQGSSPAAPIMSITSTSSNLVMTLPETLSQNLHSGQSITIETPQGAKTVQVQSNVPMPNTSSLYQVSLNAPASLTPGQSVTAEVPVQSARGTIIPASALIPQIGNKALVETVNHGFLHTLVLHIVLQNSRQAIVSSLSPNTEVVSPANTELANGARVRTLGQG